MDQGKVFEAVEVTGTRVELLIHSTGSRRSVRRQTIEKAWDRLEQGGSLSREQIQRDVSPRHSAYVAAILAKMPGVTYTRRPLTLRVHKDALRRRERIRKPTPVGEALQRLLKVNARYRTRPAPARMRMATAFDRPSQVRTDLLSIVGTDCQVCGLAAFAKEGGGLYTETHHLDELARRNPGNLCTDNVLVVCPTCHAKLHHAKKRIRRQRDGSLSLTLAGAQFRVLPNTEARLRQIARGK